MPILLMLLFLAACGGEVSEPPGSFSTTATELDQNEIFERRRAFETAIVGHELRGDGVDVVVAEDGILVGTQNGRPFNGTWVFRGGEFCYALADRVTRSNARCFRTALVGGDLHLVPVDD